MGTRLNRYYNDPNIGVAMSNLANLFAPQAPQDIVAYATAQKLRGEQERYEAAARAFSDPSADAGERDRAGVLAGLYSPTGGFEARDMSNATAIRGQDVAAATGRYGSDRAYAASTENSVRDNATRRYGYDRDYAASVENNILDNQTAVRGQDVAAATGRYGSDRDYAASVENNILDNQTSVIRERMKPLGQGEVREAIDEDFMRAVGMPGVPEFAGLPPGRTPDEIEGDLLAQAIAAGQYGPEDAVRRQRADMPVEKVVGPDGAPVFADRGSAQGQEAYVDAGSPPAKTFKTYRLTNGAAGIAVLDPIDGKARDQATGAQLPPDAMLGDVVDSAEGMTTSTNSGVQQRALAITGALSTLDKLNSLITASPSSQGLVGRIRGTAQDVIQTGGELGTLFGGTVAEVNAAVQSGALDAGLASQMYDTKIPAIEMLTNVLAWQYAKSFSGDRVSNEQLNTARQAIGGAGWMANQASSQARLAALRSVLEEEGVRLSAMAPPQIKSSLDPLLVSPGGGGDTSNAERPRHVQVNDATGETVIHEYDGRAWVRIQ